MCQSAFSVQCTVCQAGLQMVAGCVSLCVYIFCMIMRHIEARLIQAMRIHMLPLLYYNKVLSTVWLTRMQSVSLLYLLLSQTPHCCVRIIKSCMVMAGGS